MGTDFKTIELTYPIPSKDKDGNDVNISAIKLTRIKMKQEKTHWLSNPNKNFIGHWDLPEGKDLILTIKSAGFEDVENPAKSTKKEKHVEVKKVVRWVENYKPMIINPTNAQRIFKSLGVRNMEDSVGKKLQLYVSQEKFRFSADLIDCIRIRAIKYINNSI